MQKLQLPETLNSANFQHKVVRRTPGNAIVTYFFPNDKYNGKYSSFRYSHNRAEIDFLRYLCYNY